MYVDVCMNVSESVGSFETLCLSLCVYHEISYEHEMTMTTTSTRESLHACVCVEFLMHKGKDRVFRHRPRAPQPLIFFRNQLRFFPLRPRFCFIPLYSSGYEHRVQHSSIIFILVRFFPLSFLPFKFSLPTANLITWNQRRARTVHNQSVRKTSQWVMLIIWKGKEVPQYSFLHRQTPARTHAHTLYKAP